MSPLLATDTSSLALLARWHEASNRIRRVFGAPRRLAPRPINRPTNHSVRRLNALARALDGVHRYLEIGLAKGTTFENVQVPERWGVDPKPRFATSSLPDQTYVFSVPSDQFFADLDPAILFDLVFLDGLHSYQQTYRDLLNTLKHSHERTLVLVDDVVPCDAISAMPDQAASLRERERQGVPGKAWHGDVFKLILLLSQEHPELRYRTIVGGDNPQALIWRYGPQSFTPADSGTVESYLQSEYTEVFGSGIPTTFMACDEDQALEDALRDIKGPPD